MKKKLTGLKSVLLILGGILVGLAFRFSSESTITPEGIIYFADLKIIDSETKEMVWPKVIGPESLGEVRTEIAEGRARVIWRDAINSEPYLEITADGYDSTPVPKDRIEKIEGWTLLSAIGSPVEIELTKVEPDAVVNASQPARISENHLHD